MRRAGPAAATFRWSPRPAALSSRCLPRPNRVLLLLLPAAFGALGDEELRALFHYLEQLQ